MKIVYTSWAGAMAAVAAALHLGLLPEAGRAEPRELVSIPYFAALSRRDRGFVFSCGHDAQENEIYIAGCGNKYVLVERAARAAVQLTGEGDGKWQYVDCQRVAGIPGMIAESVWQMLYEPGRGELLLARLISRWYPRLAVLARQTRDRNAR